MVKHKDTALRIPVIARVNLVVALLWLALPALTQAQVVTVSGVVVERGTTMLISGADVRLTGLPASTTGVDGRFLLEVVTPGRYTLSIDAFGYLSQSHELLIQADTTIHLEMDPDPVVLDSMLVSTGVVTITGSVRDSVTGLTLLTAAQVTLYPGGRTVGTLNGNFTLHDVPREVPVRLRIEAIEYLPANVELTAERDTTLDIALAIDSVGVRLVAQQVERIATRAQAVPLSIRDLNRDEIRRSGTTSLGELIARRLPRGELPDHECIFYDDMQYRMEDLIHLPLEGIERVEIFGFRGRMVRVYSKKYVVSLMRTRRLRPITYMAAGLQTACW